MKIFDWYYLENKGFYKTSKFIRNIDHWKYIILIQPFERLKKIIEWVPVLWGTFDFDRSSVYIVLQFQLSRLRKVLEKNHRHVGVEKDIEKIRGCEFLIKRILNDDYCEFELTKHNEKWGEIELSSKPIKNSKCSELIFNRKNMITNEDKEKESEEFKRLIKNQEHMLKQDLHWLFTTLERYSLGWWD